MDTLRRDDMMPRTVPKTAPKAVKLYQVRRYTSGSSVGIGFKGRLMSRADALKAVRFLKSRGVDAYCVPLSVTR